MSIELRCPGCQNLLRVPDTAAGKQARCPQCQQIVNVPAITTAPDSASPFADPSAIPSPTSFNPPAKSFGSSSGTSHLPEKEPYVPPDPSNPYAASTFYEQNQTAASSRPLTPHRTSFDDVIQTTWKVFQAQIGPLAILGVFTFAVAAIQTIIGIPITFAFQSAGPVVRVAVSTGLQAFNLLFTPILTLGLVVPSLILLRTGTTVPGDFLRFKDFYGTELFKSLLVFVLLLPAQLAIQVPLELMNDVRNGDEVLRILALMAALFPVAFGFILFVLIVFALSTAFIADRGAGAIESLQLSWQFMRGNRITLFLLMLVVAFAGGLFLCCTLGFGSVLISPFFVLMTTVTYLQVTGQGGDISPQALGAPPEGVVKVGLPTGL